MDKTTADKIIHLFEAVSERPAMYLNHVRDYQAFLTFVAGFWSCLSTLGFEYPKRSDFPSVFADRGWTIHFDLNDLKDKGLSDEQISRELIMLEISLWKAYRDTLK